MTTKEAGGSSYCVVFSALKSRIVMGPSGLALPLVFRLAGVSAANGG